MMGETATQTTNKGETLDDPYSTLDKPYSTIDKPEVEVKKDYKFDESMAKGALKQSDYQNILGEGDNIYSGQTPRPVFNPREAVKYATLLERKYQ